MAAQYMPPSVVNMASVWMESRDYWGIVSRQWPADEDGTLICFVWTERQVDRYDCLSSFFQCSTWNIEHSALGIIKKNSPLRALCGAII